MALAVVYSRASDGIKAPQVVVEAHIANGLPSFSIVGLPETAVKESRDRVRSALLNTHFTFPAGRIVVNLAPADLPKDGGRFDLPIALGILAATGQIPDQKLADFEFSGELALSGKLRSVTSMLPFALATQAAGRQLILPSENALEASLSGHLTIFPAHHLLDVCAHLLGNQLLSQYTMPPPAIPFVHAGLDLADIQGQYYAKRALEIAASGGHNLLLIGPPGVGKTMLASRLLGILPLMTELEALELATILSISHIPLDSNSWRIRPFRAPHHTASTIALVGGGSPPKPGEISLAHQGVLFLDELPEFNKPVLEALREPLESGYISISRASYHCQFPAKFQLIAAMNPCPCGYANHPNERCQCTQAQIKRYQNRISGPLLDRIEMQVKVLPSPKSVFLSHTLPLSANENSSIVRERVMQAYAIQHQRQRKINATLLGKEVEQFCQLHTKDQNLLIQTIERFGLSARAYQHILKVSRTIADLAKKKYIGTEHLLEALSYRGLDNTQI